MCRAGRGGVQRRRRCPNRCPAPPGRHRMPREQWWLHLRLMLKMLAHYHVSMADYVSGELEHVTRRTLSVDTGF